MLSWLFHAPRRAVEWWFRENPKAVRAKSTHPAGGRCHNCGADCDSDQKACEDCFGKSVW